MFGPSSNLRTISTTQVLFYQHTEANLAVTNLSSPSLLDSAAALSVKAPEDEETAKAEFMEMVEGGGADFEDGT